MNLDPTWVFLSLIPGGIGFVLVAGLLLMIYPYFTTSVAPLIGVGALICGALWYAVRAGW